MTDRARKIQEGKRARVLDALKSRRIESADGGEELIVITPDEANTLIKALEELRQSAETAQQKGEEQ